MFPAGVAGGPDAVTETVSVNGATEGCLGGQMDQVTLWECDPCPSRPKYYFISIYKYFLQVLFKFCH